MSNWKKVPAHRGQRAWRKLNQKVDMPRPLLIILAFLFIFVVFFGTAATYYYTDVAPTLQGLRCPSGELPRNGVCPSGDPFSTLWNGQILNTTNTPLLDNTPYFKSCSTTTWNATTNGYATCTTPPIGIAGTGLVIATEGIFLSGVNNGPVCIDLAPRYKINGGGLYSGTASSVTGSSGSGPTFAYCMDVYSQLFTASTPVVNFNNVVFNFTSFLSATNQGTPTLFASVNVYPGSTGVGGTSMVPAISTGNGIRAVSTVQTNVTVTKTGSGIFSYLEPGDCVTTPTFNPTQTIRINGCGTGCGGCGSIRAYTSDILTPGQLIGVDNYLYTDGNTGWIGVISVEIVNPPQSLAGFANSCYKSGWVCFNTGVTNGNFELTPPKGLNEPAIAISNSTVQLANCAAKACAFSMATCQNPNSFYVGCTSSFYNNEEVAWFMRLNGTMPSNQANTPSWNPLDDQTVALAVMAFRNGTNTDYGVYIQRHLGAPLRVQPSDDVFTNVNGACPVNDNLIICDRESTGGFGFMSLLLNFTGGANGGTTGGLSYLCASPTTGSTWGCFMGGNNNIQMVFNQKTIVTFQLPWLNIQQAYHAGWWQAPQPNSVSPQDVVEADVSNAQASYVPVGAGVAAFTAAPWEIVSYFVPCTPSTCPTATNPQQDTGSFIGWLGGVFGGAWNAITGAVGSAINTLAPIFDIGNAIMSAFISALIQFFAYFVEGFRILFNALGGVFGLPNAGDLLIAVFTNIANFTIHFVEATFGWTGQAVNLLIQFAAVISSFIANGFITSVTNFIIGPILTLLGLIWTVVSVFFRYSVAPSYLLMVDWLFGMLYVWVSGIRGFVAWINFNLMVFTRVFRALYFLLQEAYKVILTIIGVIRGSGTGTSAPV